MRPVLLLICVPFIFCINRNEMKFYLDYFDYKNVNFISYFSCGYQFANTELAKGFTKQNKRVSVCNVNKYLDIGRCINQYFTPVGVIIDDACGNITNALIEVSKRRYFDDTHYWLVITRNGNVTAFIEDTFGNLNLSINTDIVVANENEGKYQLIDVFNFGKIQGNRLEIIPLGSWRADNGINIRSEDFKYYTRWDFNNLTLRAVTVAVDQPKNFPLNLLSDVGYTKGIAAMTKVTNQILNVIKEQHNFRLKYTVIERFVGPPNRSTPLAITNTLYWEEHDLSATSARLVPSWYQWVDVYFPHTTYLQTKFYYVVSENGVGQYENRFLTPLSLGVWWCTLGAVGLCTIVLTVGAWLESRPDPAVYAIFSVSAVLCQEDFVEGREDDKYVSQGRRLTLLVVGLTSMLLYNYYTSSVVSWLLSAARPSLNSLDQLINSDLELIFEDTGYSRGWLDNPGNVYYFSGFKNVKEDELREKKVNKAKRTVPPLQPISSGIDLIKTGKYTYHTEPYIASQVISRSFNDDELCRLGALQMMKPSPVYIMTHKRSPYKQFFVWSLLRLSERGHISASRARFSGKLPRCSGQRPRALALGQAAPAFVLLFVCMILSMIILLMERIHYRFRRAL